MLVGGESFCHRWRCVGFKERIQQLRFNPWRPGRWKSGCIKPLHRKAGGKTEVTFQRTYDYSWRKVQKRRISHLQLTQFFTHFVVGSDHRSHESTSKTRRLESLPGDTVLFVTNERKKPSKRLKLTLSVKSMAGSKKLIGMLSRYGHFASYTTTEEF